MLHILRERGLFHFIKYPFRSPLARHSAHSLRRLFVEEKKIPIVKLLLVFGVKLPVSLVHQVDQIRVLKVACLRVYVPLPSPPHLHSHDAITQSQRPGEAPSVQYPDRRDRPHPTSEKDSRPHRGGSIYFLRYPRFQKQGWSLREIERGELGFG